MIYGNLTVIIQSPIGMLKSAILRVLITSVGERSKPNWNVFITCQYDGL